MTAEVRIKKRSGLLGQPPKDFEAAGKRLPSFDFAQPKAAAGAGTPVLLWISEIQASPYQTTELDPAKVAELAENLKSNPLSTPISYRVRPDGKPEVLAGRHRIAAYELLGRAQIEAVQRQADDDEAERIVFYDNLLAPSLTDYQKYLGFARRKASKGMTGEQLAQEAGISAALVSRLLTYADLPEPIHQVLRAHPGAIGANATTPLAQIASANAALATQAVERIAAGDMSQKQALAWAKAELSTKSKAPVQTVKASIRAGKHRYAELSRRSNLVAISFASEEEAEALYSAIEALLKERAGAAK